VKILSSDRLAQSLNKERAPIILDELQAKIGELSAKEASPLVGAIGQMHAMNASVIVPSFRQGKLVGFLALGEKRSGKIFTEEDLTMFSTLANQAALAIENARFFEELEVQEARMFQSEKLASLGQLASGMAHEIHNPLTIISGEAQLYLESSRGINKEVDAVLESIIEECHRAADITRRILRFAKPARAEFAEVDLRAIVEESLQLAGYQVRFERIERKLSLPEDLPKVWGSQNQLQEVMLNLIINACQAMSEKGGSIEVSAFRKADKIQLKVADTGPGISRDRLAKIFDPFFTTKHNGTGLGLFVTQRIVKAHSGTIQVDSAEGRGTTFIITLPAHAEGVGAQASAQASGRS
jgi:signal transduction histidine kinase